MANNKRRSIDLLPVALQTETLTKFFSATIDHMLQPESVEFLAGYIGRKPVYYDPTKDFYVSETSKDRRDYQLPVTAISADLQSGQVNSIMFYDDMINNLRFHGANVQNHSRLFEQEYYSWAPPIDIDKLINYVKYIWLPDGPSNIILLNQTDVVNDVLGKTSWTYTGAYKLESTGEIVTGQTLVIGNGMSIKLSNDITPSYNDVKWSVEGVGTSIELLVDSIIYNPPWNGNTWNYRGWNGNDVAYDKQYVTIARFARDNNQWSLSNRWFHEDVIAASRTVLTNINSFRAFRPIIEFKKDLLIWDYGWYGRPDVDLVIYNVEDVYETIAGQTSYVYEGITLVDGMRLLVVSDSNQEVNNRIYTVGGLNQYGRITLTLAKDGLNPDGSSAFGDRCVVRFGTYGGLNIWYDIATNLWRYGQQFVPDGYNPPLFWLFDTEGMSLADSNTYPNSNFTGNRIFSYSQDINSPFDDELGFSAKRDQFGSFVFTNDLVSNIPTYVLNGITTPFEGYQFYSFFSPFTDGYDNHFGNSWHKSKQNSRQYVINEFNEITVDSISIPTRFEIDQLPDERQPDGLPNIRVFRIRDQSQVELAQDVDYITELDPITGLPTLVISAGLIQTGDRVICKTWSSKTPATLKGYYELPLNLTANPNNKEISLISQSQFLDQFRQIMENQTGFEGSSLGNNNYRNTAQDPSLGLSILTHRAPMLKLMVMNSNNVETGSTSALPKTDPMVAMQFAQREYVRFYGRFIKALNNLYNNGFTIDNPPEDWIAAALRQINLGKTANSPWANSGYDILQGSYCSLQSTNPTFIPPTATRLGLAPAYQPLVYINGTDLIIQTHDGSRIIMEDDLGNPLGTIRENLKETRVSRLLTNPMARAWLQFEINIFQNLPEQYKDAEARLAFDIREYTPGKWRTTEYSRDEYLDITRPMFDKWVILNQVDYRSNTTFDIDDPFSWNFSEMSDRQSQPIPGNWRGIYRWFYDTDRPHTHPWEMLGFSQKPSWWESEYGPAPYTEGNTRMWGDLRDGYIRQGPRMGYHEVWARSGLMKCIPVNSQGKLLDPISAGCILGSPSVEQARAEWQYGDGGPIESVWYNGQDHNFSIAQASYLMKPAQFIEYTWDSLRTKRIYEGTEADQWIYVDTNDRRSSSQFYVHRESPLSIGGSINIPNESTLSYFGSCGFQHWISEYLIANNLSVTNYFGNLIRGAEPRLAHKVGAYINSSQNSLRVTADSFGTIGYKSQMVPSENINTYLYRSTSIGESFYGGVIVKQVRNGWEILGYDGVYPFFNIIPSLETGAKSNSVIGNQRMVTYMQGEKTRAGDPVVEQIPYGTIYGTRQEVYDFIISYGRWLEHQGWVFDTYNDVNNTLFNWTQAATEYVYWSQVNWANGNFIALSPLANSAKFKREFGNIEFVNGIVRGTYPVLDRSGTMIEPQNLEILRYDDEIVVRPLNEQSIYGLRLFRTTLEHAIVFDNITSFGDTVYDDVYNIAQNRLKMYAYRTNDWTGRLDAPGYFLYQNPNDNTWSMIPNIEKTADDIRRYFNIEQPKNFDEVDVSTSTPSMKTSQNSVVTRPEISDLAKHMFGYQKREFLKNLLLEDSTEFEFYQGYIRQKGTSSTIDKMLRNTSVVGSDETFEYYEEFALRVGHYGSWALNVTIGFILPQSQFINTPQQLTIFGDLASNREANGIINYIPNDPRFVTPPIDWNGNRFPLRTHLGQDYTTDLPTAGYVRLGETTWYVTNYDSLLALYTERKETTKPLAERDTIWQFIDVNDVWMTWIYTKSPSSISRTIPSTNTGDPTTIVCDGEHGLVDGDLIVLSGISNVDVLEGTFTVQNVNATGNTFQVELNTFTIGTGGDVFAYRPTRFGNVALRDSSPPVGGWVDGDIAYVDSGDVIVNGWTVYRMNNGAWNPIRSENYKIDQNLMEEAELYDLLSGNKLVSMTYYDPAKGAIPGTADEDLDVKSVYDPARYNKGDSELYPIDPSQAWGDEWVGTTWWDLSTVRYIDYEIDDDNYRWKNWGKIAPGTSIDVYEWVRSPVPPSNWASYVAQSQSFSQFGINYIASGTVKNPSNPAWTETTEYDQFGNAKTWYYFWVANAYTLPMPPDRTKTTIEIKNILQNPTGYGVTWYAAIDTDNIITANVTKYLNGNRTMMQMVYCLKENDSVDHKQWELVRDGDSTSEISSYFWNKLGDSLVGYDNAFNKVPDDSLNEYQRYGTLYRPRQSWFRDRIAASTIFIDNANALLSTFPIKDDPNRVNWIEYFGSEEGEPLEPGAYEYKVDTIPQMQALSGRVTNGTKVLVGPTVDTNFLWAIYYWDQLNQTWYLERIQKYKTTNFWNYIDWYSAIDGISQETIPDYTVGTINDLSALSNIPSGSVVKVDNNGQNEWELYLYTNGEWKRVGYQGGTIYIDRSLYDGSGYVMQFGENGFDSNSFDNTPYIEYRNIYNGLIYAIFGSVTNTKTAELNTLFFSMINYVLSEQTSVDWIIKTSQMVLKGFNQPLYTGDLYQSDNIDSILAYVNEIRPYHTKIREFVSGRTIGDLATMKVTDYDKPAYEGRILNPTLSSDQEILSTYSATRNWYENYQKNPNLIRTLKTKILFDRVASISLGWSSYAWDDKSWDDEGGIDATYGAFDRIKLFYKPTTGMIPIDSDQLISGTDFKGVILNGIGFSYALGWNKSPWGANMGWNANEMDFDEFLDLIVQGGAVPQYDSFYGDNRKKSFKLSKIPQDVSGTAVWSNNVLRRYGTDWIIPNWLTNVSVIEGGTGYAVGEILLADTENAVQDAMFEVMEVDGIGRITNLRLMSRGHYDIVPNNLLDVRYRDYFVGSGIGAKILPTWGGDTLLFNDAPISMPSYAVHVLYSGETFDPAPNGAFDIINESGYFVQPYIAPDHAEELYTARIRGSVRMDVYTEPAGGHPIAYLRSYVTDGSNDQFDLVIKPQNENSVIVTHNGTILRYGISNDYVINFYTNKLVFVTPPAIGKLQVLTISTGGTGLGLASAMVVDPGINYEINDMITLDNGERQNYDPNYGANYPARVIVTALQAVSLSISSGGTGYKIGDILILKDDSGTSYSSKLSALVTNVDSVTGAVLTVTISEPGDYQFKPATIDWLTDGEGINAVIDVVWGAARLQVYDQGLYIVKPTSPFTQLSISNMGAVPGSGITVNAIYTSTLGTDLFVGDGTNVSFQVSFLVQYKTQLLVTIDGEVVDESLVNLNGFTVSLGIVPPEYSTVVITGFNTPQFSIVREYDFTVISGQYSYPVLNYPRNSLPPYDGLIILKNGIPMLTPPLSTFIGDGTTTTFTPPFIPTFGIGLSVYVDSQQLTFVTEWNVTSTSVVFPTAPRAGAVIKVLVTNQNYGFDYAFVGPNILFPSSIPVGWDNTVWDSYYGWENLDTTVQPGDEIRMITFTQDLSYGWVTETIDATGAESYTLVGTPFDKNTVMVFVDGQMQTMLWDFLVEYSGNQALVKFDPNNPPGFGSKIVVTYAMGKDDKPPLAWRTIIDPNEVSYTTAIDDNRKTTLLSNVYVYSNEIEVQDVTKLGLPSEYTPGLIWVGDELIAYYEVTQSATVQYPNRGFLSNLRRAERGTSGEPTAVYNTLYYYGDGVTRYFPAQSGTIPITETVYVDGKIQISKSIDPNIGTYDISINPPNLPAGRYVEFDEGSIPSVGWKNVRIVALNFDATNVKPVHVALSTVIDAGSTVAIPGGYKWEASPYGLQYSPTRLSRFLREHSGTGG